MSSTGQVQSFQAGSGAAFSLLPPENATGNYVKVVQRVPVKIVFDDDPARALAARPGHVGRALRQDQMSADCRCNGGGARPTAARRRFAVDRRADGRAGGVHGSARHLDRQRVAAACRRQHGGDTGRSDLDPDRLSRHQRDRAADQRLAVADVRPQALFSRLDRRLQHYLAVLRSGADPVAADRRARPAGHHRRRLAADCAGLPRRRVSARAARPGVCDVRPCRGLRAGDRADRRRLDHRQSGLALGVPDQRAGRHRGQPAGDAHPRRSAGGGGAPDGRGGRRACASTTSASPCW